MKIKKYVLGLLGFLWIISSGDVRADIYLRNFQNPQCPLEKIKNGQLKWDYFSAEQMVKYCEPDPTEIIPRENDKKQCPPKDQDLSQVSAWKACPPPPTCNKAQIAIVHKVAELRHQLDLTKCSGHPNAALIAKIKKELQAYDEPVCMHPFEATPTKFVVHHSAMSPLIGPEGIQRSHVFTRGFADIGYHYVISQTPKGGWRLFEGRPKFAIGAHAGANLNNDSLAVVISGNYAVEGSSNHPAGEKPLPPPEAIMLLMGLVENLGMELKFSKIYSHSEMKYEGSGCVTECPADGNRHIVQVMNVRYSKP